MKKKGEWVMEGNKNVFFWVYRNEKKKKKKTTTTNKTNERTNERVDFTFSVCTPLIELLQIFF